MMMDKPHSKTFEYPSVWILSVCRFDILKMVGINKDGVIELRRGVKDLVFGECPLCSGSYHGRWNTLS